MTHAQLAKTGIGEQQLIKLTGRSPTNFLKSYLQIDDEHHMELMEQMRSDERVSRSSLTIS